MSDDTSAFEGGPLTFEQWRELLDKEVERITGGFSIDDFRDWHFADAFEDGIEPVEAAHMMLAEDHMGREFLALAGINLDEVF